MIPGVHDATWPHRCGRALPKGSIRKAGPVIDVHLQKFAEIMLNGKGQKLSTDLL